MKRDAHTLRLVGEALLGPEWQSPLAALLGVSGRTVRYWSDPRPGKAHPIPEGVWPQLAALCAEHAPILDQRAKTLDRIAKALAG